MPLTACTIQKVNLQDNPNEGRAKINSNFECLENTILSIQGASATGATIVDDGSNISVGLTFTGLTPIYTVSVNDNISLSSIFSTSISADTFYVGTGSTTPTFLYDLYADLPIPGDEDYIYGARDTNNLYRWDSGTTQYIAFNDVNINNPSANSESQTFYVRLATTGVLNACTYNNSLSGVGATLSATTNGVLGQVSSPGLIDGKAAAAFDLILIKNQASALQNGIYEVTQVGDGSNPFILTRIDGYNQTDEVYPSIVFVSDGLYNINRYFSQSTANPVIGTNSLVYQVATVNQPPAPVIFVDSVTTSALPTSTYANGTVYPVTQPGYGATLSATTTGALGVINGVTITSGMRLLVKNQVNQAHNGVYTVTNPGSETQKWVLTRLVSDSSMWYRIREFVVSNPNSLAYGDRYSVSSPLSMSNSAYGTTAIVYAKNNESNLYDLWSSSTGSNSIIANNGTGNLASGDFTFVSGFENVSHSNITSVLGAQNTASTYSNYSSVLGGIQNLVQGYNSSIVGGLNNRVLNDRSSIGGGYVNIISSQHSFIGGGYRNKVSGNKSFVGGGSYNSATTSYSSVVGGQKNIASGINSFVGGGYENSATSILSSVIGGQYNLASGSQSFIGNGYLNSATNYYSIVVGGQNNLASGLGSFIGGGDSNSATTNNSSVVGGNLNSASGNRSFVGGGYANSVTAGYSSVVGGDRNLVSGDRSFVGSGIYNSATAQDSSITGGYRNLASGIRSFIGGGRQNSATTIYSSVVGGQTNLASANHTFIGGGLSNIASGTRSGVISGRQNSATTSYSTVVGGRQNLASGTHSSVIAGSGNTVSGARSIVLGGQSIIGSANDTAYVPYLNIKLFQAGTTVASLGIDSSGNVLTGSTSLQKYAANINLTADTTFTVTHNLGTTDVQVQIKDSSGELVIPNTVNNYLTNSIDINVSATDTYRIIIIG